MDKAKVGNGMSVYVVSRYPSMGSAGVVEAVAFLHTTAVAIAAQLGAVRETMRLEGPDHWVLLPDGPLQEFHIFRFDVVKRIDEYETTA